MCALFVRFCKPGRSVRVWLAPRFITTDSHEGRGRSEPFFSLIVVSTNEHRIGIVCCCCCCQSNNVVLVVVVVVVENTSRNRVMTLQCGNRIYGDASKSNSWAYKEIDIVGMCENLMCWHEWKSILLACVEIEFVSMCGILICGHVWTSLLWAC